MLYYQLWKDHARPDLIWNHKTREELREALEMDELAVLRHHPRSA